MLDSRNLPDYVVDRLVQLVEGGAPEVNDEVEPPSDFAQKSHRVHLHDLVEKKWIGKGLPVRVVAPEENVVRLGMGSVLSSSFDPRVIARISSLEEKVRS